MEGHHAPVGFTRRERERPHLQGGVLIVIHIHRQGSGAGDPIGQGSTHGKGRPAGGLPYDPRTPPRTGIDLAFTGKASTTYIDTRLPFGLRSAPFLFNQYAEALLRVLQNKYSIPHCIHYLDDYFFAAASGDHCHHHITQFLLACEHLGVPVALDKLEGPTTTLVFLGILVDSVRQQLRLPDDKLRELQHAIISWLGRCSASKRRLLSIIGKLAFAARVVPAGRLFLRRLIDLSTKAKKLHHHVKLNSEARADFQWWHTFLPDWNGVAMFLDPAWTTADQMELYTDASGTLGYGAYFQGHWFRAAWEPLQRPPFVSIQWQELFAVVAAARAWADA